MLSEILPFALLAAELYLVFVWVRDIASRRVVSARYRLYLAAAPCLLGALVLGGLAAAVMVGAPTPWEHTQKFEIAALVLGAVLYGLSVQLNEENTRFREEALQLYKRLGPTGVLAAAAATLPAIGGIFIFIYLNPLADWLKDLGPSGIYVYMIGFMIFAGLALLPTYAQAILGGWAFGFWLGLGAALVGFVGAAVIGFVVAAFTSGDRVVVIVNEKPKWAAVYRALLGGGFWRTLGLVTLLRLPPNSPFAMTNLVMAATRVPPAPYVLGTLIGMTPRTAVVVWAASHIASLEDLSKPGWFLLVSLVLAVIIMMILSQIANRAIANVTGAEPSRSDSPAATGG